MPKLSVILPVYNAVHTIDRAIKSILAQTFTDFELIVVDDGSTDGTLEKIEAHNDVRLSVFSKEHTGVAGTANYALKKCSSNLIARMDGDDFAHPAKLEKQLTFLEDFKLDIVGCQIRIRGTRCQCPLSMKRYENWINRDTLSESQISGLRFVEFPLVNPTILAKRSYFEIGFEDNGLPEDYELFLKAVSLGMRAGKVPEALFEWSDHSNRLTRTDDRYSPIAFDLCRKKHLRLGPLKNIRSIDLWGAGKTGKQWMRWLIDEGINVHHLYDVNERKIGQVVHGTEVLSYEAIQLDAEIPLLIAVGASGARQKIQQFLKQKSVGLESNAWFVA